MKKIFCILCLFCLLSGVACATPEQKQQFASSPRFVSVYTYEDGECFLDLSSVTSDEYNPPRYQISGTTHFVADKKPVVTVRHMTFRYNYTLQTIYLKGTDGKWYWLDPNENIISLCQIRLAERLFQQCYQIPFTH